MAMPTMGRPGKWGEEMGMEKIFPQLLELPVANSGQAGSKGGISQLILVVLVLEALQVRQVRQVRPSASRRSPQGDVLLSKCFQATVRSEGRPKRPQSEAEVTGPRSKLTRESLKS